jgi:hypothetical protein
MWGQCHVGYEGACVSPPESAAAYAHYHVGAHLTAEGDTLPVGVLSAGCDHAATALRAAEARDHYAHNGTGWADVRCSNGDHGVWTCGVLRPDVTPAQLRLYRAGALSGDWRYIGGGLELIAGLAVNHPGFPIAREVVTASGMAVAAPRAAYATGDTGEVQALVASGVVRRCGTCAQRRAQEAAAGRRGRPGDADPRLDQVLAKLDVLDRRTRHLTPAAAAHLRAELAATNGA